MFEADAHELETPLGTLTFDRNATTNPRAYITDPTDELAHEGEVVRYPNRDRAFVGPKYAGARVLNLAGVLDASPREVYLPERQRIRGAVNRLMRADGVLRWNPYGMHVEGLGYASLPGTVNSWLQSKNPLGTPIAEAAPFAVSIWIRPRQLRAQDLWTMFGLSGGFANGPALYMSGVAGGLVFYSNVAGTTSFVPTAPAGSAPVGEWTNVVCSWDGPGTKKQIFVNGVLVGESGATFASLGIPQTRFFAGNASVAGVRFDGDVDEPALFGRALTTAEVEGIYRRGRLEANPDAMLELDPIFLYRFELEDVAAATRVLTDASGNGNHGTYGADVDRETDADGVQMVVRRNEAPRITAKPENGGMLLSLIAGDPRVYAQTERSARLSSAPTVGFTSPFTGPITPTGTGADLIVVNGGDADTAPTTRIYGPATNPAIFNLTTGERIVFDGLTIPTGEYVEINHDTPPTVRLNGNEYASRYRYVDASESTFFALEPGENQLRFLASSVDSSTYAEITWRDAWMP